jgi:hypothetical protein
VLDAARVSSQHDYLTIKTVGDWHAGLRAPRAHPC